MDFLTLLIEKSICLKISKMKYIKFVENISAYNVQENSFVGYVPIVESENDLYAKLKTSLDFPYFGMNWDALADMFREFDWINNEKIIIIHEGLQGLNDKDFKKYIEIVLRCLNYWIHYPSRDVKVDKSHYTDWELAFDTYQPHHILFVFPKAEEKQIRLAIYECMKTCSFEYDMNIEEL